MTKDEIIRMAIQSGVMDTSNRGGMYQDAVCEFANLVTANVEKREQTRYDRALKAQCAAAEAVGAIREREKLSQPKRDWVGLTDEEIEQGLLRSDYALQTAHAWRSGVIFAMTKLKEKNNG